MDKELTEIAPKNLDGSEVVNTVKKATAEEAEAAAKAEKEKKEDYYVDPLEQESKMKEKLEKIESEKEKKFTNDSEDKESEPTPTFETSIRPDMNVTGYFSAGTTAKKANLLGRPAGRGTMLFSMFFGVINPIFAAFYMILIISTGFDINWWLNWIYTFIVILSIFVLVNSIRSIKAQNDSLKRKALIGILGASISLVPIFAWLVHWISSLF